MKVVINAHGEITLDVSSGESADALSFIRELQADQRGAQNGAGHNSEAKAALQRAETSLDAAQAVSVKSVRNPRLTALDTRAMATYEALLAFDQPEGVHIRAVAEVLEISEATAGQRLLVFVKRGLAERVGRGLYRPAAGGLTVPKLISVPPPGGAGVAGSRSEALN